MIILKVFVTAATLCLAVSGCWGGEDQVAQANNSKAIAKSPGVKVKQPVAKLPTKKEKLIHLPDSLPEEGMPYLISWKDNSHLWVLKQASLLDLIGRPIFHEQIPCELKLWDITTRKYKTVSRSKEFSYDIFTPEPSSGAYSSKTRSRAAKMVDDITSDPKYRYAKPALITEGQYFLKVECIEGIQSQQLQITLLDTKTKREQKASNLTVTVRIKVPDKRRFFYYQEDSSATWTDGPIIDINMQNGIGIVATLDDEYSVSFDMLHVFNSHTGKYLRHITVGHIAEIKRVSILPDGKRVLVSGQSQKSGGFVGVWNIETGKLIWQYTAPEDFPNSDEEEISADKSKLAIPSDYKIRILDIKTGKIERTLKLNKMPGSIAFSPDKRHLAIVYSVGPFDYLKGTIDVWRVY